MVNSKELQHFFNLYSHQIKVISDFFQAQYGVKNPLKLWRKGEIPRIGNLNLENYGIYSFHGAGCTVEFDNGQVISFDFSEDELFNFDKFKFRIFLESINIIITDEELETFYPKN